MLSIHSCFAAVLATAFLVGEIRYQKGRPQLYATATYVTGNVMYFVAAVWLLRAPLVLLEIANMPGAPERSQSQATALPRLVVALTLWFFALLFCGLPGLTNAWFMA